MAAAGFLARHHPGGVPSSRVALRATGLCGGRDSEVVRRGRHTTPIPRVASKPGARPRPCHPGVRPHPHHPVPRPYVPPRAVAEHDAKQRDGQLLVMPNNHIKALQEI
jgi:hypothetical protein